ncbi:CO dehydrogenase/acetyl-CoA synthase complex subunit epsilon [Candidatus Bathyarchaeota archaeon]|nr:MAG: CO dehydrogenase/acetyl-CoA synthase complex subunit epsilon [Candidatus Bathyarchaeota archaeon]
MSKELTGQTGEIPGPIKALVVIKEPKVGAAIIRKAKRPLIIVGDLATKYDEKGFDGISLITEVGKAVNAHINVTGPLIKKFRETGYDKVYFMPTPEVVDRLRDESWKGHDGDGGYDLVIFIGFRYYYAWLMLNGLKHYAFKWLKTLSLDPYYQPNATYTLPTMKIGEWREFIKKILNIIKG